MQRYDIKAVYLTGCVVEKAVKAVKGQFVLYADAQAEIERLKEELKNKNDIIICAKALCHKLLIKHPAPTKKHFGKWEAARMMLSELTREVHDEKGR